MADEAILIIRGEQQGGAQGSQQSQQPGTTGSGSAPRPAPEPKERKVPTHERFTRIN